MSKAHQDEPSFENSGPRGHRTEVIRVDERYDKRGELELIVTKGSKKAETDLAETEYATYSLVAKRFFDKDKKLSKSVLRIYSPHILKALSEVVEYYPAHPTTFEDYFESENPHMLLFHHHEEIQSRASETEDDVERLHLNLLLQFLDQEVGDEMKVLRKRLSNGFVEFDTLWTLFKPGELVRNSGDNPQLGRLEKTTYDQDKRGGRYLRLYILHTDYDGNHTGQTSKQPRIYQKVEIPVATEITQLSWYPLKHSKEDTQGLLETLRARGERFLNLIGRKVLRYEGLFSHLKEPPYEWYGGLDVEEEAFAGVWLSRTVRSHSQFCPRKWGLC
jgi:hypothetical protein